jgi:hypothetical protein
VIAVLTVAAIVTGGLGGYFLAFHRFLYLDYALALLAVAGVFAALAFGVWSL